MADFEPVPYRIRIGVTGHRKLDDPAAVQAMVRKAIDTAVHNLFPSKSLPYIDRIRRAGTTAISYSVLSPLAEGADRIVARAVLEYPGARLDVVLPLALEDYVEDFHAEESKKEFRQLLARCRRPLQLRSSRNQDAAGHPAGAAELRSEAYSRAGQFVVDHCDALIAVWDGEPERGRGGTAEVVTYAIDQKRPVIRVWGELIEVHRNNGLDSAALFSIDRFNRRAVKPHEREDSRRDLESEYFPQTDVAQAIPSGARDLVRRCLFPYYQHASGLAEKNQKWFHRAGWSTYTLSAAAVGSAAVGVLFPELAGAGFGVELALLLVIAVTLLLARGRHAHQSWVENRFLAERLRSGIFMAICGVEPWPVEVLPFMGHSLSVNDWTLRAFDEIWERLPALPGCSDSECLILNSYVREVWLGKQVDYHTMNHKIQKRARKWLAWAGNVVLPITIAAATVHLLVLWRTPAEAQESVSWLDRRLSFIGLLFPAIGASLAGMEAHREHLRLEKSSANMAAQLERLRGQMKSATDPVRFESLLQQGNEAMLQETEGWLMLMRFVEIKAS